MARQYRWFLGLIGTALIAALVVGMHPWQMSVVRGLMPPTQTMSSHIIIAQESGPDVPQSALFTDSNQQYSIALLDGFKAYSIAGQSVFESMDGKVAYSVMVAPTLTNSSPQLTDAALAQLAQVTFQNGEGFMAETFQRLDEGGIKINWRGQVTTQAMQPLSGSIFVNQFGNKVFLLLIAATEDRQSELTQAVAELPPSLRPLMQ